MFSVKAEIRFAIRILLIAVISLNALIPTATLAKGNHLPQDSIDGKPNYKAPSFAHPSPRIGERPDLAGISLIQAPDAVLQCVNAYSNSECENSDTGVTLTQTIDFTNDTSDIRFKVICEGWGCSKRDIFYHAHMFVQWGNGIPFELECLKIKRHLNHFALHSRLYLKAIRIAYDELQVLKAA